MNWQEYIVSDKQVLLGKPTIKGTRISVELILELFAAGWTERQVLESYPNITPDAIRALLDILQKGELQLAGTFTVVEKTNIRQRFYERK